MKKINVFTKSIIGIVIILMIGTIILIVRHSQSNNLTVSTVQNDTPTSTAAVGIVLTSTGQNSVATTPRPLSSSSIITGPSITIDLLTPIANNVWTIGQPNPIAWSNAANISGEIDLVDKTTKAFIGVITSNIGPNQTSYIWDARSIYRARYSADKTDVVPGTYSIRIHFDGNNLGDLISGPITINK